AGGTPGPGGVASSAREARRVPKANCFGGRGGGRGRGGLSLASRAGLLKGGGLGPAVSVDRPEESRLLQAIHYRDGLEMPPSGKLPQKDIDTLTRWVRLGAPWTPGAVLAGPSDAGKVTPESRNYWAYRPPVRPEVPAVKNAAWVRTPIDAFILAKLEAQGLSPAAPAGRVALIRRVTYDLTGLPTTPEQVDAFVNDRDPQAYEK